MTSRPVSLLLVVLALFLCSCANKPPADYTELMKAKPASILILPPVNNTPEVIAGNSFSAWSSIPIAEQGYYVFPVALTTETFHQNGMTEATDVQKIPVQKLHEIFGADAAMYITIEKYGTQYMIIGSQTQIEAKARLVDLRTGTELWKGDVVAVDGRQGGGGSPLAMLITAAIDQVVAVQTNVAHNRLAGPAAQKLYQEKNHGLLPGPRYPEEKEREL